jgi:hypothetical protein
MARSSARIDANEGSASIRKPSLKGHARSRVDAFARAIAMPEVVAIFTGKLHEGVFHVFLAPLIAVSDHHRINSRPPLSDQEMLETRRVTVPFRALERGVDRPAQVFRSSAVRALLS